jgi:hypothetical protein
MMLPLLFFAQVETSSTSTPAIEVPEPPPVVAAGPQIDRFADNILYVGTPLIFPQPSLPPPAPPALPAPPPPPAPAVTVAPPPLHPPPASMEARRWLVGDSPWIEGLRSFDGLLMTIAIVLLMVLASLLSSFTRRHPDSTTLLTRLASGSNKVLRILAAMLVLILGIAWLPNDALPFALLAAALAFGWSLRDVLPDLIGGAVLAFERRVKPGMWVAGEGYSGVVERVGLRATWLRDASDRRVAVPNRNLVSNPVTSDANLWPTREVTLRVQTDAPAEVVRRALIDAVLASPWTPLTEVPSVQRDGADPAVWLVRARVLDLSFANRFEGELLERAEAMLRGS